MSDKPQDCTICYQKDITQAAIDWCSDCDQFYCPGCITTHGLIKASKYHRTIPIKDYLELKTSLNLVESTCKTHDERYQLFCQSHDSLLCHDCLDDHAKCNKVTSLTKLTKNIKESETLKDIREALEDNEHNVSELQQCINGNIQKIKDQTDIFKEEITTLRKNIDRHLDDIEKKLRDKFDVLGSQLSDTALKQLDEFNDKKTKISLLKKQLEDILKYGNETQIFFCLREIANKIKDDETFMNSFVENNTVEHSIPSAKINAQLYAIAEIKEFGAVSEKKEVQIVHLKESKAKQAQIAESTPKAISDIKAVAFKSKDTKGNDVTGCDILPDGRIVLSNYNPAHILVLDGESGYSEIDLPGFKEVCDVVVIDDNRVAVSCLSNIVMVDVLTKRVISTINIGIQGWGLVFVRDSIFVSGSVFVSSSLGCLTRNGIKFLNTEDSEVTKMIHSVCTTDFSYIASLNECFYISDSSNKTVKCIDHNGSTIWSFNDTSLLQSPWGIAIDKYGYVYVACRSLSNVIVISPNGLDWKVLLSKSNGIDTPTGLHVDRENNRLIVSNKSRSVFWFSIS